MEIYIAVQYLPAYKNLEFKNLLAQKYQLRLPFHKNLFSLKFETGSYFRKWTLKIFRQRY